MNTLKVGDKVPEFSAKDQDKERRHKHHRDLAKSDHHKGCCMNCGARDRSELLDESEEGR